MEAPVAIPFNRPCRVGRELDYIADAIRAGHTAGGGRYTERCERLLREALCVNAVLLTTSCTHALEMAAVLLDIGPGDEILLPSFTFVSVANAFVLRGARPVFVDIRPDTLNIDERQLQHRVTSRTKAIVPVHYAGVGCEMNDIVEFADDHGVAVVEDNAHGLFASYKSQFLGTFGPLATQSFHETKNFTCGEGGALVINDEQLRARAEIIRDKGTNRASFLRGQVDKYSWVDIGSSYPPADLLAAYLYAQLEARDDIHTKRRTIWERYARELSAWAKASDAAMPYVPEYCEQSFHMFYLLLPTGEQRQHFIDHLQQTGIHAVFHYVPLHTSTMGQRFGGRAGDCPVAESISERLVRLPFFTDLTEAEQTRVIEAVTSFAT